MRPEDFRKARNKLGLSRSEFAHALALPRRHVVRLEEGWCRTIPRHTARLVEAFESGFRTGDWPKR